MPFSKANRVHTLNGILFVALFAFSSFYLATLPLFINAGISSLIIAIVLGIIYSNTLRHELPKEWDAGIHFSAKRLLRLAIVLYGFRINVQQILSIGIEGFILDLFVVVSTLLLGFWIGVKLLKLDRHLSLLIAVGSAICGAAAVLALEDILKSEPYKATVAVGTVVLFGTFSMFFYPFLQHVGWFHFDQNQFGLFAGASIHEVAQVVVAANGVSEDTGNLAVIVKMTRVLLLVPVLFIFSFLQNANSSTKKKTSVTIPWFAIGFVGVIAFNSLNLLPAYLVTFINQVDLFLLTMAMAAIGIETNLTKIKKVGLKPLYLSFLLLMWLMLSAWGLIKVYSS